MIGGLKDVSRLVEEGYSFINTIYKIDGMRHRVNLFESLEIPESQLATFIHPQAYVAPNAEIGPGSVIYPLSMWPAMPGLANVSASAQGQPLDMIR